jgi:hypothetical protein
MLLRSKHTTPCHGTPALPDVQMTRQLLLPGQLHGWMRPNSGKAPPTFMQATRSKGKCRHAT